MSDESEIHLEHMLGRRVRDASGAVIGRIEEVRVDIVDGETVVTEWHLGAEALFERLGGMALQLPFIRRMGDRPKSRRIPWQLMDLSDPRHPRLRESY